MQFFKKTPNFDFMSKRKLAAALSVALMVTAIVALAVRGLNFGLDFTGGTLIEVGYPQNVELAPVREALREGGYADAIVQHFGTARDVLVRIAPQEGRPSAEIGDEVLQILRQGEADVQMRRQEFVGPQIGEELRDDGGLAMLWALFFILIYVVVRFEWRMALGAIAALVHDVLITMGCFALFQWDFDLTVLAAVLAVIGYSLNDTIVVFDRVRENFRKIRKGTELQVVNTSLNQTLSRTLMTSLTTLLVLIAMFFFGGELIHSFSIALILGVVVGTYSSIYVATSSAVALGMTRANLMPVQKEGADQEQIAP
ncbi:MAG: protein translocase subunit SecF [Pseudomonadota bacterium]|nr:MAG: protein translocase subunit SecF [Pseudomonadota bacterium]